MLFYLMHKILLVLYVMIYYQALSNMFIISHFEEEIVSQKSHIFTFPEIGSFFTFSYSPINQIMVLNVEAALGEKAKFITSEELKPIGDTSSLVVMDGIAVVDEEKAKKLRLFLLKKIQPFGSVVKNDIFIPINPETGMSYG